METLLHASNVAIEIDGRELVSHVDIELGRGATLGIVGESGSGKSLACRAFAGLLATVGGRISRGTLDSCRPGFHRGHRTRQVRDVRPGTLPHSAELAVGAEPADEGRQPPDRDHQGARRGPREAAAGARRRSCSPGSVSGSRSGFCGCTHTNYRAACGSGS